MFPLIYGDDSQMPEQLRMAYGKDPNEEFYKDYKSQNDFYRTLKKAPVCKPFHVEDFLDALKDGRTEDKQKELYIRMQIWWRFSENYNFYLKDFVDKKLKSLHIENMERMLNDLLVDVLDEKALLSEIDAEDPALKKSAQLFRSININLAEIINNDEETNLVYYKILMKAEICRNLGRFEECRKILREVPVRYKPVPETILKECERRNKRTV